MAAQNPDAEVLFNEGERLEAAGQIAQACQSFEASNKIEPRAGTMIRLGDCRVLEGKLASAWTAFKDALTRVQDPAKRQYAELKIAQIEPRLSYLTVTVADDHRVDGLLVTRDGRVVPPVLWNRAAPVDGGVYNISAAAPEFEPWTTRIEVPVDSGKISVDIPRLTAREKPVEPPAPVVTTAPAALQPEPVAVSPFTARRKLALGVAGLGVVTIAVGGVIGIGARGLESDAFSLCPDPAVECAQAGAAQDQLDRASSRATIANVALGVGGGMLIGAAVLWLTGAPRDESNVAVSARIKSGDAGVAVTVRF